MYKRVGGAESHSQLDRAWKENAWKMSDKESWSRNVDTQMGTDTKCPLFSGLKKVSTAKDRLNN